MNYVYLVKVFNIKEGEFIPTLEEETIAACTDKNRAEEILKYNIAEINPTTVIFNIYSSTSSLVKPPKYHPLSSKNLQNASKNSSSVISPL